jgi:DNA polymerase V
MSNRVTYIAEAEIQLSCPLPLFSFKVSAGFPSPAEDYIEGKLDLNQYLIESPSSTFFFRVAGESMVGIGIFPNDLLIVDKSKTPKHNNIVVAVLDDGLVIKRLYQKSGQLMLLSENDAYPPIIISEGQEFEIWGVVTSAIHNFE